MLINLEILYTGIIYLVYTIHFPKFEALADLYFRALCKPEEEAQKSFPILYS